MASVLGVALVNLGELFTLGTIAVLGAIFVVLSIVEKILEWRDNDD